MAARALLRLPRHSGNVWKVSLSNSGVSITVVYKW